MPQTSQEKTVRNPKTAVVILNWNGADMLRRFLPSVVSYTQAEAEVIVADNGSSDDSARVVAQEFPTVRLLPLDKNYGFAEGYNRAIQQIQADYVVLLNSDVEVTPGWLTPLVHYMENHPDTAACQPKLRAWRSKESFEYAGGAGGFVDLYGYPFCRGRIFSTLETDEGQYDDTSDLLWATGAALLVRRSDWEAVGGLDARFFAHMEEIDLCWRLRCRGRRIVCIAESKVYHVGGATLSAGSPRKTFLNFRNNLFMLYKNLPDSHLRHALRVRRGLDWLAALKFLLTDGPAHARAVFEARREFKRRRSEFQADRRQNLQQATLPLPPEVMPHSLLCLYYIKGHKTFAALRRYFKE